MFKRKSVIQLRTVLVILVDILVVTAAQMVVPVLLRGPEFSLYLFENSPLLFVANCLITPLALHFFDQYNLSGLSSRLVATAKVGLAVTVVAVATIFLGYLVNDTFYTGRWQFVCLWLLVFITLAFGRHFYWLLLTSELRTRNALIIGCGDSGRAIVDAIKKNPLAGIRPLAFLDTSVEKKGLVHQGVPVYVQAGRLRDDIAAIQPDLVILAMRRKHYAHLIKDIIYLSLSGIEIWDVPTTFERLEQRIPLRFVDETWLLFVGQNINHKYLRLKRSLDVVMAVTGLIVSLPVLLLVGLAIRLESKGPALFVQKRVAKGGKVIDLYKLRSMYCCDPKPGDKGTVQGDSRITSVGRIIRKLHIDELPQLLNVLKGELSIVGPRAELLSFIREYWGKTSDFIESPSLDDVLPNGSAPPEIQDRIIPYFECRFTVPQGITGWSQIRAPMLTSSHQDMTNKLELDLFYVKNMSLGLDVMIIINTLKIVILGKGK